MLLILSPPFLSSFHEFTAYYMGPALGRMLNIRMNILPCVIVHNFKYTFPSEHPTASFSDSTSSGHQLIREKLGIIPFLCSLCLCVL